MIPTLEKVGIMLWVSCYRFDTGFGPAYFFDFTIAFTTRPGDIGSSSMRTPTAR